MNGRIYDAEVGRFLQADPVIQAPDNVQSWNAYTYCFNNPLAYTDPSGNISFRQVLGIAIAVVGTWVTMGMDGGFFAKLGMAIAFGAASGYVATGTLRGAVTGAFTARLTFGIGTAFQGANLYAQMFVQGLSGGIIEGINGGNFGNGFLSAALTTAFMPQVGHSNPAVGAVRGALVGGTISKLTGGKFANGAISGAIQGAMSGKSPSQTQSGGDETMPPEARIDDPKKARIAMARADAAVKESGIWDRLYTSETQLARDWGKAVYPVSEDVGAEIGAKLFKVGKYYVAGPSFSTGSVGQITGLNLAPGVSIGRLSGYIHTHPNVAWGEPRISYQDIYNAYSEGVNAYVYSANYQQQWNYNEWSRMPIKDISQSYVPLDAAIRGY